MSQRKGPRRKKTVRVVAIVLGVVAAVGGIAAVVVMQSNSVTNIPTTSHGQPLAQSRTVVVAAPGSNVMSMPGQIVKTVFMSGKMPVGTMMATITSDENCMADANGVSHCTNRMRLDDGTMLTVMHPHMMANVQCLSPGERVQVQAA